MCWRVCGLEFDVRPTGARYTLPMCGRLARGTTESTLPFPRVPRYILVSLTHARLSLEYTAELGTLPFDARTFSTRELLAPAVALPEASAARGTAAAAPPHAAAAAAEPLFSFGAICSRCSCSTASYGSWDLMIFSESS